MQIVIFISFVSLAAIANQMKPATIHTTHTPLMHRCVMCSYCCNWQ